MYLEVYPDIVFVLNFFIDFILLFLLKKVNRKDSNLVRLSGAAAIGAAVAAIVSAFPWMHIVIRFVVMNVAVSVLMLLTAFGRLKKRDLLKQVISLYLITYFVGGFINSIYYYTNVRLLLLNVGNALIFSNISWRFILLIMLLMLPALLLLLWILRSYQSNGKEVYDVELLLENQSVMTKGLMDTGNCLYDPVYKRPVMVVERSLMEELLSEQYLKDLEQTKHYLEGNYDDTEQLAISTEHLHRIRYIPYQSIGKTKGMMQGIILDKAFIYTGKETICNEKVTAAICDNHLSPKEEYHVILHKELL